MKVDEIKKDEIIAKLTELGIEHDPSAKKDDLFALLPDNVRNPEGENTGNGGTTDGEGGGGEDGNGGDENDGGDAEGKGNLADVLGRNGQVVRTYSKDAHGKNFRDLAKSFATKIGGKVQVR